MATPRAHGQPPPSFLFPTSQADGQVRGMCIMCGGPVTVKQQRTAYDDGSYAHQRCIGQDGAVYRGVRQLRFFFSRLLLFNWPFFASILTPMLPNTHTHTHTHAVGHPCRTVVPVLVACRLVQPDAVPDFASLFMFIHNHTPARALCAGVHSSTAIPQACNACGGPVTTMDLRTTYTDGSYAHNACLHPDDLPADAKRHAATLVAGGHAQEPSLYGASPPLLPTAERYPETVMPPPSPAVGLAANFASGNLGPQISFSAANLGRPEIGFSVANLETQISFAAANLDPECDPDIIPPPPMFITVPAAAAAAAAMAVFLTSAILSISRAFLEHFSSIFQLYVATHTLFYGSMHICMSVAC